MVITNDFTFPSDEELTVQEVNLSTPTLRAAAFHMGKHCEQQNNEFMLCRQELQDPRQCLKEGKNVTACSLDFFRLLKKNCMNEFNQYANCLDKASFQYEYNKCRRTQAVYDKCVLDKLNMERPGYGYFCRARVHDSPRPKPEPERKIVYEDATPTLPKDYPKPPAKYGSRAFVFNE